MRILLILLALIASGSVYAQAHECASGALADIRLFAEAETGSAEQDGADDEGAEEDEEEEEEPDCE